jgi:multiple RNA-binding domain-containing protein 1
LEQLFSTFGELKFVRMPKNPTGKHRGFAFVEFKLAADANSAFKALKLSTHIYGRYAPGICIGLALASLSWLVGLGV